MKKEWIWVILAFIAGVLIGALVICKCWCCCSGSCETDVMVDTDKAFPQTSLITEGEANTQFHKYMENPDTVGILKGFTINMAQYNAMGQILSADTTVNGFRIYMGADSLTANRLMMVVGTGSPDKTSTIYETEAAESGPCPYVCDDASPIIK
jgi:hypothetical protein